MRCLAEKLSDKAADERNASGAADQHHFIDVTRRELRVAERLFAGLERAVDDRPDQRVEFATSNARAQQIRLVALGQIQFRSNHGLADALDVF